MEEKVFISYSWDDELNDKRVLALVEELRRNGFNATYDKEEIQKENSIHLNRMMKDNLQFSNKVIVILSTCYKRKADTNSGGVGIEYNFILEDIQKQKNKYILVSFEALNPYTISQIVPSGFEGRYIIDLKGDSMNNYQSLFSNLMNEKLVDLSPVSGSKPILRKETMPKLEGLLAETVVFTDNIPKEFIDDSIIVGTWVAVDFVENFNDYNDGSKSFSGELFLKKLTFLENGKTEYDWLTWTKGNIIHKGDLTVSRYIIRENEKSTLMYFEWKSGDYIVRNQVPWYYVLSKKHKI